MERQRLPPPKQTLDSAPARDFGPALMDERALIVPAPSMLQVVNADLLERDVQRQLFDAQQARTFLRQAVALHTLKCIPYIG